MNKKQVIASCITGILILIFFGFGFMHFDIFSPDVTHPNYPGPMEYVLVVTIYGKAIGLNIPIKNLVDFSLHPPFTLFNKPVEFLLNRNHLIIITCLIGSFLVYSFRKKE